MLGGIWIGYIDKSSTSYAGNLRLIFFVRGCVAYQDTSQVNIMTCSTCATQSSRSLFVLVGPNTQLQPSAGRSSISRRLSEPSSERFGLLWFIGRCRSHNTFGSPEGDRWMTLSDRRRTLVRYQSLATAMQVYSVGLDPHSTFILKWMHRVVYNGWQNPRVGVHLK